MTKGSMIGIGLVIVGLISLAPSIKADLVYNNGAPGSDLGIRFNPATTEVGDEIILAGSLRLATNFTVEYWGTNFSGNETAQVRFYANDGANGSPSSLFWDSGSFSIAETNRATLVFDLRGENVTLPDSFTWTIQFFGVDVSEGAGLDLYNPVALGNNYDDYWDNGSGWQTRTNDLGTPMNFGAQVYATVPEPGTLALALLSGMGLLALRFRSRG